MRFRSVIVVVLSIFIFGRFWSDFWDCRHPCRLRRAMPAGPVSSRKRQLCEDSASRLRVIPAVGHLGSPARRPHDCHPLLARHPTSVIPVRLLAPRPAQVPFDKLLALAPPKNRALSLSKRPAFPEFAPHVVDAVGRLCEAARIDHFSFLVRFGRIFGFLNRSRGIERRMALPRALAR